MEKLMPKEIEKLYEPLRDDLYKLYTKRELFRQLYESGDDVIDILRFAAPGFFVLLREIMIDDMLLAFRRLIDPERSRGKKRDNLSLRYLKSLIEDPNLKTDLTRLIGKVQKATETLVRICSRRVAHCDLVDRLDPESLPPLKMKSIDDALRTIKNVLNKVFTYWSGAPVVYEMVGLTLPGGGNDLVNRLRQAMWYCQQLRELEESLSRESTAQE